MSLIKGGFMDRRGFMKTTAASAMAATLSMGAAVAAPQRGGHLRVAKAHGQTTDTLDPGQWTNGLEMALSFAVHGRLTEVAADGSLVPELAESWEATSDATEWRLKIRGGVTFHDGKPLTVEDVVASINHHRGENSTSAAGPLVEPIVGIATEGSDTVVFKLSGGNADFPFILSDYHLTIHPVSDGGIDWRSGNGCGSYVLKNFQPGVVAEFERHMDHWRDDVAWVDSCEILSIIDPNARMTALVSGDVHAIDRVDLKAAGLLSRKPGTTVESVAGTQHYTFAMATNQNPYTDNNIRLALKYAINREELVEKILFGYGSVGNDHPIGAGQRYYNSSLEQKKYDPDKAKYYLKQAGLDSLDIALHTSDAAYSGAVDAGVLYQNSAKEAGINIKVVREPKDGYWSDVWMKKPMAAVYWGGRPVEDQMFTTSYKCGAAWNDSFWCNERFEDLLVKARAELDDDKRRKMYWEMQEIVSNDGGVIVPMFANNVHAIGDKIGHGEMASNWEMDGERWMERWWLKT